jgi:hypothetical protein
VWGVDHALAHLQTILRSVKGHHLLTKGKQVKRQVLTRWLPEVGQVVGHTGPLLRRLGDSRARVTPRATSTLVAMHEVAKRLMPQIVPWITTGGVAKGKIVQAGITQARALVRHKAGKEVEFGLPYLRSRLGGGYIFGTLIRGVVDEAKRPLQALAGYRALCGAHATPELVVYDRGGDATATLKALAHEGVKQLGSQPKGQRAWHVAEDVRQTGRSERGKTEGIIGTLKTDTYGFNKPKERLGQTLEMAGPRSILSFNLHKLMRDLVRADRGGEKEAGQGEPTTQRLLRGKRQAQRPPLPSGSFATCSKYERAINENAHGTLLMHNTQSASGESHGVHHQLLSEPAMHPLRSTRLRRSSRAVLTRMYGIRRPPSGSY